MLPLQRLAFPQDNLLRIHHGYMFDICSFIIKIESYSGNPQLQTSFKFDEMSECFSPFHPKSAHSSSHLYTIVRFLPSKTFLQDFRLAAVLVAELIGCCSSRLTIVKALIPLTLTFQLPDRPHSSTFIGSIRPWSFLLASLLRALNFHTK